MSRTYRRAGARYEYAWVLREMIRPSLWAGMLAEGAQIGSEYVEDIGVCRFHDPDSPEGKRRLAKFHSDAQRTMRQVPAAFRRSLDRSRRKRDQRICRMWARSPDDCGPILDRHLRDALWRFW